MGDRATAIQQFHAAVQQSNEVKAGKPGPNLAYQLLASSVMNDATFTKGWHHVGDVSMSQKWTSSCIAAHRRALELGVGTQNGDLEPKEQVRSLVELGHCLHLQGRNAEGRKFIERAIDLEPDHAPAWCCLSLCQSMMGEHDLAVASAHKGHKLEPANPEIEMALGMAHFYAGNMRQGLRYYEARYPYRLKHFLDYPHPQWKGEPGKRLVVVTDQGMGDALSFSRFVPKAIERSKFVHMVVQKELVRLFQGMFQQYPNINVQPAGTPFVPADAWSSFVSLPHAMDLSEGEIRNTPNVPIPQFGAPANWKAQDRQTHIGVAWRGSPAADIEHHRNFPVDLLLRLYEVPGVQLYSLQFGEAVTTELHGKGLAPLIYDLSPYIQDAADSAAIIRNLDLVVTVESFPGHLAGAVGTECWIPYSYGGRDYRLGDDGSKPLWYAKHRCFKQAQGESWEAVFERIVQTLKERVR